MYCSRSRAWRSGAELLRIDHDVIEAELDRARAAGLSIAACGQIIEQDDRVVAQRSRRSSTRGS
jgi:hypothetical protein